MGYTILEMESLPEPLKNKPRWVSCLVLTAGLVMITLSAVSIGTILGYTYCYVEHRSGFRIADLTQSTNLQIRVPYPESDEAKYNRTLHGALRSNLLISRIFKIGSDLITDVADTEITDIETPDIEVICT